MPSCTHSMNPLFAVGSRRESPASSLMGTALNEGHMSLKAKYYLFVMDPVGTVSRFTITPHRHYPLQQTGSSPVGVMPPAAWDGFRKKTVLTPRNSPTVHSPVTVKIARPDPARSSFFNHLNSPGAVTSPGLGAQTDPCSREAVLRVLRESRKREVDEDKSVCSGQKNKRRRHDSSESSQSAFEPLLANGASSQLVPKPGTLKRGMNSSLQEETTMKRSRTSSISSLSFAPIPSGVPGSARNPIRSSYSSSQGYPQRRPASSVSLSPYTSPGGSRCQTPERASKKAREDSSNSPSSASLVKMDKVTADFDPAPATAKVTPKSEAPSAAPVADSESSGSKRKRKIQLVTTNRSDQISLPPPPELGYTITTKDLDLEKKAAISQIQKALEEPEPEIPPASEPTPALAPALALFAQPAPASTSIPTSALSTVSPLGSLAKPVPETTPVTTMTSAPTIDLTISVPSTVSSAPLTLTSAPSMTTTPTAPISTISNPLLESLKSMKNSPLLSSPTSISTTTAAPPVPISSFSTPAVSVNPSRGVTITQTAPVGLQASFSAPSSISSPASKLATSMSPAFAQILAQPLQLTSATPSLGGGGSLFSLIKPVATPASEPPKSTVAAPVATISLATSVTNHLSSGFKPIVSAPNPTPASTIEVKPTQPTFKPLFGSGTTGSAISAFGQTATPLMSTPAAPASLKSGGLFGGLTSTQPTTVSTAPPTVSQSLFGSWSTTTTSAPGTNSTFQFGVSSTSTAAPVLNTNTASAGGTTSAFQFGAPKPASAPQTQSTFTFGQISSNQSSTPTPFGSFGMTSNTTTSSETPTKRTTFGTSTFTAASPSTFPGSTAQAPVASKPFTFGESGGSSNGAQFTFGAPAAAVSTVAPAFGTNTQSSFGVASSGLSFGNTTTPSATTVFGASSQTPAALPAPAPSFSFGGATTANQNTAPSTLAAPAAGGFNFGASTPFGTPAPAPQTPGFSFGANNTDNKTAFGESAFLQQMSESWWHLAAIYTRFTLVAFGV
ncbi:hypothetical protein DNTS_005479 [Danionella cerebrum]|uniref:Uncharacterized protein n=1 Tax=Danionella cerebrum TaxID=2873325 RepID=A0A553QZL0_9TELE|nr:hypothetical protein DNTS_005479 [Danionella translucida]